MKSAWAKNCIYFLVDLYHERKWKFATRCDCFFQDTGIGQNIFRKGTDTADEMASLEGPQKARRIYSSAIFTNHILLHITT